MEIVQTGKKPNVLVRTNRRQAAHPIGDAAKRICELGIGMKTEKFRPVGTTPRGRPPKAPSARRGIKFR